MCADHLERVNQSRGNEADADRWAEIARDCQPRHSFTWSVFEYTTKVLGAAAGGVVGGVAGAVAFENPITAVLGAAVGSYDGWKLAGRYVAKAEQDEIDACTVDPPPPS
jgi:uncharacterized membrane protein